MRKLLLTGMVAVAYALNVSAAVDPNFYVYLCFGQSNMEGQAEPQAVDKVVDSRFKMMACVNFTTTSREMGQWYDATPPLVRDWTKVGMADYFGRTMVAALPSDIKIGVVDVAIGGVSIDGFLQEKVSEYITKQEDWMKKSFAAYDNDPYQRLVDMAKIAQQSGVIKGILLHQGESDNGQQVWLEKVDTVYRRLLRDLNLKAEDVPLFAGETVGAEVGGTCALHNTVIAQLPTKIPTAHVVHSTNCPCASDNIHFTIDGYRTMGKRYAYEALKVMGKPVQVQSDYQWNENTKKIYTVTGLQPMEDITLRVGGSKLLTVWAAFADGHSEDVTAESVFTSSDFTLDGNKVLATEDKQGTVTATYTDFFGQQHAVTVKVSSEAGGPNHVLVLQNPAKAGANTWDYEAIVKLNAQMEKGKKYVIRATMRGDMAADVVVWPRFDASTNRDQWGNSADIQYLTTLPVSTTYQELTWNCTATYAHDVLIFAIGKFGGNVYMDDLSCMEVGGTTEMVNNGSFESDDLSDWSVLGWTNQKVYVQEDATLGIDAVAVDRKAYGQLYDLQGRRLQRKPVKGVYLLNGKKYVSK